MSSTIVYEPECGIILRTPRPDLLWRELVRLLVPEKSDETGDSDPYGTWGIEIGPRDVDALKSIQERWPEVTPLINEAARGKLWVRREP